MKIINYPQLIKMIEPGKNHPVLINTLPREEFEKAHIPGSLNIPADQIGQKARELFSKHDYIVVYCSSTSCMASHKAGDALEKAGFTNVFRFAGGIEDWKRNNSYLCTETDQPQTTTQKTPTTGKRAA